MGIALSEYKKPNTNSKAKKSIRQVLEQYPDKAGDLVLMGPFQYIVLDPLFVPFYISYDGWAHGIFQGGYDCKGEGFYADPNGTIEKQYGLPAIWKFPADRKTWQITRTKPSIPADDPLRIRLERLMKQQEYMKQKLPPERQNPKRRAKW